MAVVISMSLTFLSLLVVGQASDLTCEELMKPLDFGGDYGSVMGKWIFVEGIANNSLFIDILKTVNSSWIEFAPTSYIDTYSLSQGNMLKGICEFTTINATLKDNTVHANEKGVVSKGTFLKSCADCLTISFISQANNTDITTLYLFTRKSSKTSDSETGIYWKQAECLGYSKEPQYSYDGVTDFCQRT